jgi:hypothetical protein
VRALLALVLLAGCATTAALDDTLRAIGNASAVSSSSVAAVASRAGELLATSREQIAVNGSTTATLASETALLVRTLREGVAASSSSVAATTAAVASTTQELDAILSAARPNLVASSVSIAAILSDLEAGSTRLREKSEQPLPRSIVVFLWVTGVCLLALLLHAVWSHRHLSRTVKNLRKEVVELVSE